MSASSRHIFIQATVKTHTCEHLNIDTRLVSEEYKVVSFMSTSTAVTFVSQEYVLAFIRSLKTWLALYTALAGL